MLAGPNAAAYCASKYFVLGLSEALWFEQKARGVHVLCVCPGPTSTDFFSAEGANQGPNPPKFMYQTADQVAKEAVRALMRRVGPTIVPGFFNRAITAYAERLLGRRGVVNLMGNMR